jgi:hypothetical protein
MISHAFSVTPQDWTRPEHSSQARITTIPGSRAFSDSQTLFCRNSFIRRRDSLRIIVVAGRRARDGVFDR